MGTQTEVTGGGKRGVPGEPPGSLHKPPTTGLQPGLQSNELSHNSTDTTDPEQQPGCIPSPGVRSEPKSGDHWGTGGPWGGHTTCISTDSPATGDCTTRGAGGPGRSKKPRTSGSPGQGKGVTGEPPGTVQQLNRGENENNGENGINANNTYNIGENEENIGGKYRGKYRGK